MESSRYARVLPTEGDAVRTANDAAARRLAPAELAAPSHRAIGRTVAWLMSQQHAEGYWVGELEGDTILESEYILLLAYVGRQQTPLACKAARRLIEKQLPSGGWAMYPGGAVEVSGSVKAYFALKLTGHDPSAEYMRRARAAILAHGGADAVNSFTRFYLALLGQISYEQCPAVPPEIVLLPKWFPVHLYAVSAWSRTIIVPLAIMSACQPVTQIDLRLGIRELFLRDPRDWPPLRCPGLKGGTGLLSWDRFFRTIDRGWKWCQRYGVLPLRRRALAAAERWILARFEGSDGLGAIFPPMIWSVVALKCLGYEDDSPEMIYCHERLAGLVIEDEDTARLQPCKSPVWDTAISLRALSSGGVSPADPAITRATDWLLERQIMAKGDWAKTVDAEPGGWCFEHANDHYPDLDDTVMVLMALAEQFADPKLGRPADGGIPQADFSRSAYGAIRSTSEPHAPRAERYDAAAMFQRTSAAIDRGERWVLAMQNRDGGWGAFDRNNDREFLCYVPFADHNAMIDPSTPDLSARVLEALGRLGRRVGDPAVDRAVAYLRSTQEADGSWFGRWGVNYIYGTWQVLVGLRQVGVSPDDVTVAAGANWLLAHQQASGAWGESADSYAQPHLRGQGPATASQTAWAVLGLVAAGQHDHPATLRGVGYLLNQQRCDNTCDDGTWDEQEFTGTGFPRVFYLRYHMYRVYFPLLALAEWATAARVGAARAESAFGAERAQDSV